MSLQQVQIHGMQSCASCRQDPDSRLALTLALALATLVFPGTDGQVVAATSKRPLDSCVVVHTVSDPVMLNSGNPLRILIIAEGCEQLSGDQ